MPKRTLFFIVLIVIVLTSFATIIFNLQRTTPKSEIDTAVNQAKHVYNQVKGRGEDFSNGPCLSNALMPGWVLDIAHSPRLPIDDLPQNQCSVYHEGRSQHFVELDPNGNLIRAK